MQQQTPHRPKGRCEQHMQQQGICEQINTVHFQAQEGCIVSESWYPTSLSCWGGNPLSVQKGDWNEELGDEPNLQVGNELTKLTA